MTYDEKKIIENSLSLWTALILHQQSLITDFYSFCSSFKQTYHTSFVLNGVTNYGNDKIRDEFYNALTIFAKINYGGAQQPFEFLSLELFNNMPAVLHENRDHFNSNT